MTYDDWDDYFQPIPHGDDEVLVHEQMNRVLRTAHQKRCLWTLVEGAAEDTCFIIEGTHVVNRIGYIVTRVSYDHGFKLSVSVPAATE